MCVVTLTLRLVHVSYRASLVKQTAFLYDCFQLFTWTRKKCKQFWNVMRKRSKNCRRLLRLIALGGFHIWCPENFGICWPPSPLVTYINQLILFLSSAFWGPLSPFPVRTSYMEARIKMLVKSLLWWLMFACRTLNWNHFQVAFSF